MQEDTTGRISLVPGLGFRLPAWEQRRLQRDFLHPRQFPKYFSILFFFFLPGNHWVLGEFGLNKSFDHLFLVRTALRHWQLWSYISVMFKVWAFVHAISNPLHICNAPMTNQSESISLWGCDSLDYYILCSWKVIDWVVHIDNEYLKLTLTCDSGYSLITLHTKHHINKKNIE